jgi:hypothetical protein
MKATEAGERLFDYFTGLPPGRSVTRKAACVDTGLTPSQWTNGRAYLRDLFGRDPLIHLRISREVVYLLAGYALERDAREYWERLLRGQITRARREYNDAHGIAEAHPTAENERQAAFAKLRLSHLRTAYRQFVGEDDDWVEAA